VKVGLLVAGASVRDVLSQIQAAEAAGIDSVWMTSGPTAPDPLAVFAAAAAVTERIGFGSAIVHTFPRHPVSMAATALVVEGLAPGRLRLGVGPSAPMVIEPTYGISATRPQEHLREYLTVLRALLGEGRVDFTGKRISAKAQLPGATGVRVMASALRATAYRLCGEVADGAISWVSPLAYLRDSARPAMLAGAAAAGRPAPALVAHVPVVVSDDPAAAREAFRKGLGFFARIPNYQNMLADAGHPEVRETGSWSDAAIDALVVHGPEAEVEARLNALPAFGIDEAMVSIFVPDGAPAAVREDSTPYSGELRQHGAPRERRRPGRPSTCQHRHPLDRARRIPSTRREGRR
jgi:F420-dependent oxidoreductase-like protein